MYASFRITALKRDIDGDYVSFDVVDGETTVPACLSATALRILAGTESYDSEDVFIINSHKIRKAAFRSMRANPSKSSILLGRVDFTSWI